MSIKQGLVIIDMQYNFHRSYNATIIAECVKEVKRAKRLKLPIFIVEYVDCGYTEQEITDAVGKYKNCHFVTKYDDSGALELKELFEEENYCFNSLRVCGVNSDCCVAETVCGINYYYPKMKIYLNNKASGTFSYHHTFGIAEKLKNVKKILV